MLFRAFPPETRTLPGARLVLDRGFHAVIPVPGRGHDRGVRPGRRRDRRGAQHVDCRPAGHVPVRGVPADRWGDRRSVLTGCLVRTTGRPHRAGASGHRPVPEHALHRRFAILCALASVNRPAYAQSDLTAPVELQPRGLDPRWLAGSLLPASGLNLTLQLIVAGTARRIGPGTPRRADAGARRGPGHHRCPPRRLVGAAAPPRVLPVRRPQQIFTPPTIDHHDERAL